MNQIQSATLFDHIATIGRDCDKYGGELVMLLASKDRAEQTVIARPNRSTRARIRRKVELNLVQRNFAAEISGVSDFHEREKPVIEACRACRREYGDYWLAEALYLYYSDLIPAEDVDGHITQILVNATNRIVESRQALKAA